MIIRISIKATVEAFIFTIILRQEHNIAKPTKPECMERSQRKIQRKYELTWSKQYHLTGRDMPQQKSSGVAILVSLQECGFFSLEPCTGKPTLESHRSKLGLRSTSSNAINPKVRL